MVDRRDAAAAATGSRQEAKRERDGQDPNGDHGGHAPQVTIDLEILALVTEGLENAEANGYPQLPLTDYEIAIDIGTYDADLEGREPEELMPYIAEWRKSKEAEARIVSSVQK